MAIGHHQAVAMRVPKIQAFGNSLSRLRLYRGGQNLLGALSDNRGQSIAGEEGWQFHVFGHTVTHGGVLLKKNIQNTTFRLRRLFYAVHNF
jgi:hypothetical protein